MLKAIVRGHYDLQKLRIQTGNRIVANFRAKMNIATSETAEKAALNKIKEAFKALPKKISKKKFTGTPVISKYAEYVLVKSYVEMLTSEHNAQKEIKAIVDEEPLWASFFSSIKGVGPLMAGILLTEIDITKAATPAALWKYCGVDVAEDGKGRSMRKEHLIDREYINKEGKKATKKSLTYNPRLNLFRRIEFQDILFSIAFFQENYPRLPSFWF